MRPHAPAFEIKQNLPNPIILPLQMAHLKASRARSRLLTIYLGFSYLVSHDLRVEVCDAAYRKRRI
jgi:hypothetical protein